jgi:pimeloyl-ACP methyl ester carboxylesterase
MPAAVVEQLKKRMEQRFTENVWQRLATDANAARLSAPALIIHDEDDAGVPWQQGARIARAWPGAQFLKTRGLGHGRILRDAGVIAKVVAFIRA